MNPLTLRDLLAQLKAMEQWGGAYLDQPVMVALDPRRHPPPLAVPLVRIGFNEQDILPLIDEIPS